MRKLTWMMPVIGAILIAAGPSRAQIYDPNFPVCLQTYGIGGGYIDCSFVSQAQCALSAGGRAAQCLANPYFAHAGRKSAGRPAAERYLLDNRCIGLRGRNLQFCRRNRFRI